MGFLGRCSGLRRQTRMCLKEYSDHSYLCTLCGRCAVVCPAFIETKDVRMAARGFMVEKGEYPDSMNRLVENPG